MLNLKPIPGFSRYGITTDAKIFNLKTGAQLRTSSDVRGYRYTILVNDAGERKGMKRHRLVALTHLDMPDGDPEMFVVNHKDHIPGNDAKDNLEWCTQKENIEHWKEGGKEKTSTPVEVLDVKTGETTHYESIGACARELGINRYSIHGRLARKSSCIWPEGKRYRVGGTVGPWPPVDNMTVGRSRKVILKDLKSDALVIFDKLSDVLPYIGYKLPAVWKWANDYRQPVVPGLYQLQFTDKALPWREVDDVFEELQMGMQCKVVVRFDADWGAPVWYESAVACGKLNNLKPTALNYRLKSKGQTVYSDGKRYCYYSELPEDQKKTIRYEIPPEGRVQRPSTATAPWCRMTSV